MKQRLFTTLCAAFALIVNTSIAQSADISSYHSASKEGTLFSVSDHMISQVQMQPTSKNGVSGYKVESNVLYLSEAAQSAGLTPDNYTSSGFISNKDATYSDKTIAKFGMCDVPFGTLSQLNMEMDANHITLINQEAYCAMPALTACKMTDCYNVVKQGDVVGEWVIGKEQAVSLFLERQASDSAKLNTAKVKAVNEEVKRILSILNQNIQDI